MVPPLAESISEGTLAKWNKKTGDFVKQDEEIVTIETDKVDAPVNSPYSGKILELYANEQDTVVVGQDLCKVELGDAPASESEADSSKVDSPKETPEPEPVSKQKEDAPPSDVSPFGEREDREDAILKKHGIKLGFMSAFVKASSFALQEVPAVNASIAESGDTIIYRDYVDMSVAVATPKGLVTPVIRNAHLLSFIEIEKVIAELDGKMTIEDMAGGTFTISNGGVFGSLLGTPIINLPQSGILGMHATKDRPVVINGKPGSVYVAFKRTNLDEYPLGSFSNTLKIVVKYCDSNPSEEDYKDEY
ncbi:9648_t:CDS:2, partial [Racocetra fulgida]